MENKRKHLEFIQGVINRMARCSFLIKGWCITLVAALVALAAKEDKSELLIVTIIPILIFWTLDGFFLYQERLYRSLYDEVRIKKEEKIDYSMNTSSFVSGKKTWFCSIFSKTLNLLYISLILLVVIAYFFLIYI
ncbi:MAG: hypothetical protein KAT68_14165 [Bacteroidales bacterium]|nr:hypothetical protein [Bacteroidales bacterium]